MISAACGSFRRWIFCVISGSRNDLKHWVMLLPPSAASVSERFAECFLHLFFCFIRHVDQSESIEHSVYIGHTPDIAQRFRTFNYLSYLFNIAQSQQHGTPRQTFTILSAIDPQFLGEFISPALFQRIAFVSFASNNKFSNSSRIAYRLQQQSIRRLVLVPPYFVFCSISFRCGGLSIERNQKPSTPENTLAVTHHDKQKQVEVKRSSRVNPHEIRLFSGCPYAVVK